MKSEKILRALTDLPDDMVEEAAQRRRHPLVRAAALAACLLMAAVSLTPLFRALLPHGNSGSAANRPHPGLTYQGAVYQLWDEGDTAAADRLALPQTVPDQLIGSRLDAIPDYGDVYAYAPLEGRTGHSPAALYLLQQADGTWQYMVFAGFSDSAYVEGDTLLLFYGVTSGADIQSLHPIGEPERAIDPQTFVDALTAAQVCGTQDFYRTVFAGTDWDNEAELTAKENAVFANSEILRLETVTGIVSYPTYYPAVGCLEWMQGYYDTGPLLPP